MDLGLRGRRALVVGGSMGIGKGAAALLAAEGARVVIAARGRDALEAAAREIAQAAGVEVLPIQADASDPDQVEGLAREAARVLSPTRARSRPASPTRAS